MPQISHISLNDIHEAGRIDAEYFKPEYLEVEKKIMSNDFDILRNVSKRIDVGFVGSMVSEYVDDGVLLLQTKNVDQFELNLSQTTYINKQFHFKLKKSQVKYGDILIARSGSFGKASIYLEENVCNSSDIIIVEANLLAINNFYLTTFLNSKFGVGQLYKFSSGGLQGHINLTILENLKIPLLPRLFQREIENLIIKSHLKLSHAKQLYNEAEDLLLQDLGIVNYNIKYELNFSVKKSQIDGAQRIDSEYFQPKYNEIINKVIHYEGGWDFFKNIIHFKDRNFNLESNKKYKYLALSNISNQGYIQNYQEELGQNLPSRARRLINTNDLIISSIEGSLSSIAIVDKEFDNAICSTGFFVLNSIKINPETLLVLFKSFVIQELLKRGSNGTILTAISKAELESIKIPLIRSEIQTRIAQKIHESDSLRNESKKLLEEAKRKVEMEIES